MESEGPTGHGHPFDALTPDVVMDALAAIGLFGDGRLMGLFFHSTHSIHLLLIRKNKTYAQNGATDQLNTLKI